MKIFANHSIALHGLLLTFNSNLSAIQPFLIYDNYFLIKILYDILLSIIKGDFIGIFEKLFDYESYMPHGYCLLWQPELLWMHVIPDIITGIAYFTIPASLLIILIQKKQKIPFHWVFIMFGLFIVLCGITHFASVIVLWYPYYYLQGLLKTLTAGVSIVTAIMIFQLLPQVMDMINDIQTKDRDDDE